MPFSRVLLCACSCDGMFDSATTGRGIFTATTRIDANAIVRVQTQVRR
jgi:hypothetical protein